MFVNFVLVFRQLYKFKENQHIRSQIKGKVVVFLGYEAISSKS